MVFSFYFFNLFFVPVSIGFIYFGVVMLLLDNIDIVVPFKYLCYIFLNCFLSISVQEWVCDKWFISQPRGSKFSPTV